jgi:hypothetical protein
MTKSEFELIARLLRSKEPVITAVQMVIFDQVDNADAARSVGVTPQAVHRSAKRFLAMHKEICAAFKKSLE